LSKKAAERLVKECWIAKQKAEMTLQRRRLGNAAPSGVASRRRPGDAKPAEAGSGGGNNGDESTWEHDKQRELDRQAAVAETVRDSVRGRSSRDEDDDDDVRIPLESFLHSFLMQKYKHSSAVAVEMGYSLVFGCQRFSYDADLAMFLAILQGRLPEEVHERELTMLASLRQGLEQIDRAVSGGRRTGFIHREDLVAHLREAYATKTPEGMAALLAALGVDKHAQREQVPYGSLLAEDEVGDQSNFTECLRDQFLQEYLDLSAELSAEIASAATGQDDRYIKATEAQEAILRVDPEKPREEVRQLVARGFGISSRIMRGKESSQVQLPLFLRRLKSGWLQRSTRRVGSGDGGVFM